MKIKICIDDHRVDTFFVKLHRVMTSIERYFDEKTIEVQNANKRRN